MSPSTVDGLVKGASDKIPSLEQTCYSPPHATSLCTFPFPMMSYDILVKPKIYDANSYRYCRILTVEQTLPKHSFFMSKTRLRGTITYPLKGERNGQKSFNLKPQAIKEKEGTDFGSH